MTKEREALKQALEALEQSQTKAPCGKSGVVYWEGVKIHEAAITAIKEALAQPPLPVQPQRPWVGLTDEEFAEILCDDRCQGRPELMLLQVQAKLKEKNT